MQTFLIVLGILFLTGLSVIALGLAFVRKLAAVAARFMLRTGLDALNGQAKALYAAPVRPRLEAVAKRVNDVPAASLWNAGRVLLSAKELGLELAQISQELDRLKVEDQRAQADAITIESTDATPAPVLALPAPPEGTSSPATDATSAESPAAATAQTHDEILAAFHDEFVKPGNRSVVDAWLTEAGGDTFIQYQLSMDAIERFEQTGSVSEVPSEYKGLPTVITWFPR